MGGDERGAKKEKQRGGRGQGRAVFARCRGHGVSRDGLFLFRLFVRLGSSSGCPFVSFIRSRRGHRVGVAQQLSVHLTISALDTTRKPLPFRH